MPEFPYTAADFNRHRIIVTGDPIKYEGIAAAAVTPGCLMDGPEDAIDFGGASATDVNRRYILERGLTGDDTEEDYAIGDTVLYGSFRPGDRVWARLGASEEIAAGDVLEADTGGLLVGLSTGAPVARAVESVTTGAGGAGTHIIVEVL